jgi:pimeloyl-ACP methyl ester carboxylesterase
MYENERSFKAKHTTINYIVGPNNGLPLLLLHGQSVYLETYFHVFSELSEHFQVYLIDVHGHGKTSRIKGNYTLDIMGEDLILFLEDVVNRKAIISGNSSGGLLAIWLGANAQEHVLGIVPEDPPLFSSEFPRIKNTYAYHGMKVLVNAKKQSKVDPIAHYVENIELPVQQGVPDAIHIKDISLRLYDDIISGKALKEITYVPRGQILLFKGFQMEDPKFAEAFLDGSMANNSSHVSMLSKIKCPMLLMHASWYYHEKFGLVGAMDGEDIEKIKSLVENLEYKYFNCGHGIHHERPKEFIETIINFSTQFK